MGDMREVWEIERDLNEAKARRDYFLNRPAPVEEVNIETRGASTTLFYRSMHLINGAADPALFQVDVPNTTLALVTAAEAGLLATLPVDTTPRSVRGSGMKPARMSWYRGKANPVRKTTAWGTRWGEYYDSTAGRSHYSIPFSRPTGIISGNDLSNAFYALVGPGGSKTATLLGAANGRAHLKMETITFSAKS